MAVERGVCVATGLAATWTEYALGSSAMRYDSAEVVEDRHRGTGERAAHLVLASAELSVSIDLPAGIREPTLLAASGPQLAIAFGERRAAISRVLFDRPGMLPDWPD